MIKKILLSALFFCLLSTCASMPKARSPASDETTLPLKVLTLNVWDVGFASGELTEHRLRRICERFQEEAAKPAGEGWDVILVQELWPWTRHRSLRNCGYRYISTVNTHRRAFGSWSGWLLGKLKGDAIDTGLYVLSRYPTLAPERHTYNENGSIRYTLSDGDYLANKSVMFVTVLHPQIGPVQVFNTHLVSRNSKENYNSQRRVQLKEMADFIGRHFDARFPAFFGGDLNFGPPSPRQTADPSFLDEHAWDRLPKTFPGFRRVGGDAFFCTYCGTQNFFARYENPTEVDQNIDHLFVSNGFEFSDAQPALTGTTRTIVPTYELKPELQPMTSPNQSGVPADSLAIDLPFSDHFGFEATLWAKPMADADKAATFARNVALYCHGETPAPPWCWWSKFPRR